jgi:hypothetical protein
MMSSAAWRTSHPITLPYSQWYSVILSGHITTVAKSRSGQQCRCCTIAFLSARYAGFNGVTCPHVLLDLMATAAGRQGPESWDTCMVRSPPQQEGKVWSHGTYGGARALLSGEVGSRAAAYVVEPDPSPVGRWGLEPQHTWQHRSPPQWGGGVRCCWTHVGTRALLSKEAGSGPEGCMVACGSVPCALS